MPCGGTWWITSTGLFARERPDADFFALALEFGTLGESVPARIRALRAMVLENQLRQHGAVSQQAAQWVRSEFSDLFLPKRAGWYRQAGDDTRQAFAGILGDGGFIVAQVRRGVNAGFVRLSFPESGQALRLAC